MLKKFTVYLILTLTMSIQGWCQTGFPFIYNYGSEDYFAGIQNWDITQDVNGRIYVANNFGLLVFNGKNWQLVNTADGTKLRSVLAIKDRIYAGYQKDFGYYHANDQGELVFVSLAQSLSPAYRDFDEIWKIYTIDDVIYFCGFDFIFKFENEEIQTLAPKGNLEISYPFQKELYIQASNIGLTRLYNNEFELVKNGEFFNTKRISGLIPYDKNKLLISTFNNGLFLHSDDGIEEFKVESSFPLNSSIINAMIRLRNGDIALGTQNNGLLIIDKAGQVKTHLNKSRGLLDNTINSMFEDSQGNLWLSLNNGISRVEIPIPYSKIDFRAGVNGAGYAANQTTQGLFLGTNNGLYLMNNGQTEFIQGSEGQVYSIQEIDQHIFIGHNNGPMVIENKRARLLDDEKGAWLFRAIPDRTNEYLIGSYLGLRKLTFTNNQWTIKKVTGFDESSRVMHFQGDELWVTQGYKGAFKLSFSNDYTEVTKIGLYNSNKGFPTDLLINVFDIGNQLIFGSESGVFEYNSKTDRFERIAAFDEALGGNISLVDLDTDELGNIYYIASNQIGKLTPKIGSGFHHETSSFNLIMNLWNNDLGNIQVLSSEEILIGAREGFIHYQANQSNQIDDDFQIQFSSIQLNNSTDSILYAGFGEINNQSLTIPFRMNNISFDYSATHFASEGQMEYSYKIDDFGEDWSPWTKDSKQSFTNLYEGDYSFQVKARNVYGKESNIVSYQFKIRPPIYRTKAAYSFYVLGSFALLFLGFKTLDYRFKKEKAILEDSKNKVISEKEAEIKSVSEKSEAEIMQLKNDKLSTELKLKNQALTSSAMNLIQKNQLLNQIKNTLKSLSDDDQEKATKTKLQRIVKSIERDLSSSEEWEQFEEHFDQVHGQFITRLKQAFPNLTPQELKFSAYLRMNLNTKEMANLLNISVRGVEIGRYRVRKKLGLERSDNLSDFILRF